MIEIKYRIVLHDYDDFQGENGFFQIKCNGFQYGELYSKEIETVMDTVSVYDWFERMLRIVSYLRTEKFVALSDVESYNTWITFKRKGDNVIVGIMLSEKGNGVKSIEFNLDETKEGEWTNQEINYEQLKHEILNKVNRYINDLNQLSVDCKYVRKLEESLMEYC